MEFAEFAFIIMIIKISLFGFELLGIRLICYRKWICVISYFALMLTTAIVFPLTYSDDESDISKFKPYFAASVTLLVVAGEFCRKYFEISSVSWVMNDYRWSISLMHFVAIFIFEMSFMTQGV